MNWTDEDKAWLTSTLTTVVDTKLKEVESRMTVSLQDTEQRILTAVDVKLEAVETKLLSAFHAWASPMEARQRTHTATLKALDAEMEYSIRE